MVLTFNFKEGEKTITFDELKKEMKSEKTGSEAHFSPLFTLASAAPEH